MFYKRGEIATTLTIITLLVLTAGVFVGTQLTQENTDVRSRTADTCPLKGNPQLIAGGKCQITTDPYATLVCALIDPSKSPGSQLVAGQDPESGPKDISWFISGGTGTVQLYKEPSVTFDSNTQYRVVVYDWNNASSCVKETNVSGSSVIQSFGSSGGTNPPSTSKPNTSDPTATPTPIACSVSDKRYSTKEICDKNYCLQTKCVPSGECYICPNDPTPTPTATPTPTPTPASIPAAASDKVTRQILWIDKSSGKGLCWGAKASSACSLNPSSSSGSGNVSCTVDTDNMNVKITNNGTESINAECARFTCSQCSQEPGTSSAKCNYNNSTAEPISNNNDPVDLIPGCTLTCGFNGGISGTCDAASTPTPQPTTAQTNALNVVYTSTCGIKVESLGNEYLTFIKNGQRYILQYTSADKIQETINLQCQSGKLLIL